ncbi:MAG: hypothetical protein IJ848_00450 [Alphaproteobacteria bacterium]|nr:hypothetical protein [Alphaproteobacteria bacterium]
MNRNLILTLVLFVTLGVLLSKSKYEVVSLRKQLKTINREIVQTTDDLKVYNAEWSYLNEPKRLQELAKKYLPKMTITDVRQIETYKNFVNNEYEDQETAKHKAFESFLDSVM